MLCNRVLSQCISPIKKLQALSNKTLNTISPSVVQISDEIVDCLKNKIPVVALESTIITHGMPYPENLQTAIKVENIVRRNNAVPATIGVIEGKVCIGMNQDQIEKLATRDKSFIKMSRRDLPFALSKGLTGGTTVAATMALAHRVGIEIFVTGGIGGVHRGGELSMDVSADLLELSRTPMTVVSAGVKSILDIGRTLEFLETHGVCVATFGHTKDFPAFFTPHSGFFAPSNVETVTEAARLIVSRDSLALDSGILIAVPIPPSQSADGNQTEESIVQALEDARAQNIAGKDVTPFVLSRVLTLSGGASLRANMALIENNAHVGSLIAVEVANTKRLLSMGLSGNDSGKMMPNKDQTPKETIFSKGHQRMTSDENKLKNSRHEEKYAEGRPVIVGGSVLDLTVTSLEHKVQLDGSTHRGRVESCAGGVGRNLADCLSRLSVKRKPFFVSALGSRENGQAILAQMTHMDTTGIRLIPEARTAVYAVILQRGGDCLFGIGDMAVHNLITPTQVETHEEILVRAPLVAIDGNVPLETMNYVLSLCADHRIPVWFEPTDVSKASKPFECDKWQEALMYVSPNLNELRAMYRALHGGPSQMTDCEDRTPESVIAECLELGLPLMRTLPSCSMVVTLGALGTLLLTRLQQGECFTTAPTEYLTSEASVRAIHYLPPLPTNIVSVSGAGDCFAAAMIGGIINGLDQGSCVRAGQKAAMLSLASYNTVPDSISVASVFSQNDIVFPHPVIVKV